MSTGDFTDPAGGSNVLEPQVSKRNTTGFVGPLNIEEGSGPGISVTSPQTRDVPLIDARITKNVLYQLPSWKVRLLKLDPTITLARELVISPAIAADCRAARACQGARFTRLV